MCLKTWIVIVLACSITYSLQAAALQASLPPSSPQSISVPETEASRFRFAELRDALRVNFEIHVRNVWTTLGFLFVGIGWIITSEAARQFLAQSPMLRRLVVSFVAFAGFCHAYMVLHQYSKSSEMLVLIKENEYAKAAHLNEVSYLSFSLSPDFMILSLLLDEALFLLLASLIVYISRKEKSRPRVRPLFGGDLLRRVAPNQSAPPDSNRASHGRHR